MAQTLRPYPGALLNPCVDPIFKILFTTESSEAHQALTCFLSDILQKPVTDVVLQPNELSGEAVGDKQAEFDINCKIDGKIANVEMQGSNSQADYGKRAEYHAAHVLNHYTPKGLKWQDIPQVFQISVLNFVFDSEEKNCVNYYCLRNEDGRVISRTLNVIFMELPKIAKLPDDIASLTPAEMWGKFFLYASDAEKQDYISELAKHNRGIAMAFTVLKNVSQDELNWYHETRYWMHVSDELSMKEAARQEGLAEGRQKKAVEDAIELLKENVSPEIIAKCVKLPIEQIQELAKQLS
ncbi:MAG: Rpn family recombination-promoting nuclease/putative transposase [Treponemataceae bacterium]|nr:Rpn family recombination-promoting nuclease/putative transposase [Treponemataceae bacterium]